MKKVLCVCHGNTCRSPMMQAVLTKLLSGVVVESAGTNASVTGNSATPHSVTCMDEIGIDISGHKSRWVGSLNLPDYSHIICVGEKENKEVLELLGDASNINIVVANADNGGIPNPWEQDLEVYRDCANAIQGAMREIATSIEVQ